MSKRAAENVEASTQMYMYTQVCPYVRLRKAGIVVTVDVASEQASEKKKEEPRRTYDDTDRVRLSVGGVLAMHGRLIFPYNKKYVVRAGYPDPRSCCVKCGENKQSGKEKGNEEREGDN